MFCHSFIVNYSIGVVWNANVTKVRPLFTLSHRGYDTYPLVIVFSANNIDQSNLDFYASEGILEVDPLTF